MARPKKNTAATPTPAQSGADIVKIKGAAKAVPTMLPVGQITMVQPNLLNIQPGMNPRLFNPANKEDVVFAESLRNGVEKAIEVRQDSKGKLWIMDGHRRYGAINWLAREAKPKKILATVPVVRLEDAKVSTEGKKAGHILSSANFQALTPMQQGAMAKRMLDEGYSEKAIALEAGKTTAHIKFVLAMQGIPESVARFVTPESETGIASYTALQIVKEVGAERAEKAIVKALDAQTRKRGLGATIRVTRKHLHEADEGIPLDVGGTESPKGKKRAAQQTTAPTKTGETPTPPTKSGETPPAKTPTPPAPPAKPVLEVNGFRVRVIGTGRVVATFDSTAEAAHYLPYLSQGYATAPVPRGLSPTNGTGKAAALSVTVPKTGAKRPAA